MQLLMIILPVFMIFAIGFGAQKFLRMDIKAISSMSLYILIPILTFDTFYRNTLTMDYFYLFLFSMIITLVLAGITVLITRGVGKNREETAAVLLGALFPNSGNYGAPVILFALGALAFDYAIVLMVIHGFIIGTVGILIASLGNGAVIPMREAVLNVLKTPIIYGAFLGVLFEQLGIPLHNGLVEIIQMTGNAAIPVVMLILGMQLAEIKKEQFDTGSISIVILVRMIISPLAAAVLVMFMPVDETMKMVFIILNAMPVAANSTMLAIQFNTSPNLVSLSTLITTLLSIITIPLCLLWVGI